MMKASSIYAIGNISRQLVGFIMLPIYTQHLTPADYGVVGLLVFMVSLIELVFGGHMFNAVPKFYYDYADQPSRHKVISSALILTSIISGTVVAILVVTQNLASIAMFGTSDYGLVVAMFSVQILTHALEEYALSFIRIQKRPWLFIFISLAKLALQLALNIWFVVIKEMGVLGVASSAMLSSIFFALALSAYTIFHTGLGFDRLIAKRMLVFSWPLWLAGLAGLYIGSSNRYYIRIFSSLDEVGLYELAAKFGSIIGVLIWQPFAQYWQIERFSIQKQENPIPVFQSTFAMISTLMILAGLGISIFSPIVISLMAAPEFQAAANAVPFLTFGAIFGCLTIFCNFSFLLKEKTGWMSRNNYLTAIIVTIFYVALIPPLGFVGAAAALAAAQAAQLYIVNRAAKKLYDMQLSLAPVALYTTISAIAVKINTLSQTNSLLFNVLIGIGVFISATGLIGAHATNRTHLSKLSLFNALHNRRH
jgi:O-antigen/teichoic acid export membrane protein